MDGSNIMWRGSIGCCLFSINYLHEAGWVCTLFLSFCQRHEALDGQQYTRQSIALYESIYGVDFVSPGGADVARELIGRMDLVRGARVLDAGCGLGGSSFMMAGEFGFQVTGMDLSNNMLDIAREKLAAHGLHDRVELVHGDCSEIPASGSYDAVYSRDVFLHIHDKARLFNALSGALAGGGTLLFTDYCCGEKPWPEDFETYVTDRNYCLHTLDEYSKLIESAGFENVVAEDLTSRFTEILEQELETIAGLDLKSDKLEALEESWKNKVRRSRSGCPRWGLFVAPKPRS